LAIATPAQARTHPRTPASRPRPPLSAVTGAFYFTDPSNLELLGKILDFGDRIAFFYGTLSDLEYTLTVEDTVGGTVRTYRNAAGNFCGGLDNHAF